MIINTKKYKGEHRRNYAEFCLYNKASEEQEQEFLETKQCRLDNVLHISINN